MGFGPGGGYLANLANQGMAQRGVAAPASGRGSLGDAWGWLNSRPKGPQIGENPYTADWQSLISQLGARARGDGQSLAGDAFKQASAAGMRQQQAMAAGGSAGAARQAGMNMQRINQGQAFGYSNARLQEQLAAQQALQGALTNAGNAWFQPQQMNLQAQLAQPTNMQTLTSLISGIAGIGGMIGGGGGSRGMSPIAAGNPGAGGYYTPT